MHRSTLYALVVALVLITPAVAAAEAPQGVIVRLGDVDTTTDRGADRALRRIRSAAQDVCDAPPALRSFEDRAAARACVQEAMSRAVDDLGDPRVAARFNGARVYAQAGRRS